MGENMKEKKEIISDETAFAMIDDAIFTLKKHKEVGGDKFHFKIDWKSGEEPYCELKWE